MAKRLLSSDEVDFLARVSDLYSSVYGKACPCFLVFQFSAGTEEKVRATYKLPTTSKSIFWTLQPFSAVFDRVSVLLLSLARLQESSSEGAALRADPVVLVCEELKLWLTLQYASLSGVSSTERQIRLDYLAGLQLLLKAPISSLNLEELDSCVSAIAAMLKNDAWDGVVKAQEEKSVNEFSALLDSLKTIGCCGALFLFYVLRDRRFSQKLSLNDLENTDAKFDVGKAMESQSGQWLLCLLRALPFKSFESSDFTSIVALPNAFLSSDTERLNNSSAKLMTESEQSIWVAPYGAPTDPAEIGGVLPFFRRSPKILCYFLGMHGWLFEIARSFAFLRKLFQAKISYQHPALEPVYSSLCHLLSGLQHDFRALCVKADTFDQAIDAISRTRGVKCNVPLWSLLASRIQKSVVVCETLLSSYHPDVSLPIFSQDVAVQTQNLVSTLNIVIRLARPREVPNIRQRARELDHAAVQANRYAEHAYRHMIGGNPSEAVHCFSLAIELNPLAPELSISRAEAADLQAYSTGGHDRQYRQVCLDHQDLTDERKLEEIASHIASEPFCWSLERVELTNVGLTSMGAFYLVSGLLRCSGLVYLSLAHNQIDDEGIVALAQLLVTTDERPATKLEYLNLASNSVSNRGVIALAGALGSNSVLMYLDLSENAMEDLGVEALTEAILANAASGLEMMNLGGNRIKEDGICALTKLTREKVPFVDITLGWASGSSDVPEAIDCAREVWLEFEKALNVRRQQGRRPSVTEFARNGPPFELTPKDLTILARLKQLLLNARGNVEVDRMTDFYVGQTDASNGLSDYWPLLEPCRQISRTFLVKDQTNSLINSQLNLINSYEDSRTRFFHANVSAKHPLTDKVTFILNEHREWLTRLWTSEGILLGQNENSLVECLSVRVRYLKSLSRERSKLFLSQSFCELIISLTSQLEMNNSHFQVDRQLLRVDVDLRKSLRLGQIIVHQIFMFLTYCHLSRFQCESDKFVFKGGVGAFDAAAERLASLPCNPLLMGQTLSEICENFSVAPSDSLSLIHVLLLLNCPFSQALFCSSASSPCSSSSVMSAVLTEAVFKYGSVESKKRQVLPPRIVNTSGPLYASGEPVMAYAKNKMISKDEPFAAVVVKRNNNGTYHVRFQDGESDYRCLEEHMMTRDWQPKVRAHPDTLVWMEPLQVKSKTKSHIFSMYKSVEVDEFSGFVLQKRKKSAGEGHRAPVRIVSCSSYPFWEVAYFDSLDEARAQHWKYIKEIGLLMPRGLAKDDREAWIINHIQLLIKPPLSTVSESKKSVGWLSRFKPLNVDLIFTERLLDAISAERSELLEKSDVQNFLGEWCSHHGVANVEAAVRDFWEKFDCEDDGRIARGSLVSFLTTPVPIVANRAPPPPPASQHTERSIAPTEVKLGFNPHFERLHGLSVCLLSLLYALCFEIDASQWLHPPMYQKLSTLLQWISLTLQLSINCVKAQEAAFENYEKALSLTNSCVPVISCRPPTLLTKSLLSILMQAVEHFNCIRDLVVEIGAQAVSTIKFEPLSKRSNEWLQIVAEIFKKVSDFVPRDVAASLASLEECSCTCSVRLHYPSLPPLDSASAFVEEKDEIQKPEAKLRQHSLDFASIPAPPLLSTPVSGPSPPTQHIGESDLSKEDIEPQVQLLSGESYNLQLANNHSKAPPSSVIRASIDSAPEIRRVITVTLPKGMASTQTKIQVVSSETVKSLKSRLLAKFGGPSPPSCVLCYHSIELADDIEIGRRNSFVLQIQTPRDLAKQTEVKAEARIAPEKVLEAAQYVSQAEEALRAGNESAAQAFFELQRMCLAEAAITAPSSRVEQLTAVHRDLKSQEKLALQYKRDAERYMKAGLSQSAVKHYDLQRDAFQRIEELRSQLRALKGELEVTIYAGQSPSVRGVFELLQAQRRMQPNKGAASAALVFNLELGFLPLAVTEGKTLLEGLDTHPGIRRLSLHSSNMDDLGICALADLWGQAVRSSSQFEQSLTHLDLNSNSIGTLGAEAIAQILTTNQVLEYLDLSCNPLSSAGCLFLIRALEDNPLSGLKILRLGATGADDTTAKAVLRCLSYNFSLMEVFLHGNQIVDKLLEHIAAKLQRPRSSMARETHAAQWRTYRDEYLSLSLSSFIGSVSVLLDDFLEHDHTNKSSLRLMVGFRLWPAKLKQAVLSLKPKKGPGRFNDHSELSILALYHGLLSALSFAMKVARVCFRQQEKLRSLPLSAASRTLGPLLGSVEEPLDSFSCLFDQPPLQEIQDWFEALVVTAAALTDRLWWHLEEALLLADRNPSLIKLSLSLLSVTKAKFLKNEDYKAEHTIINSFLPATRLPPGTQEKLRTIMAAQKVVLDLLFVPEEDSELRGAIEQFLKASMARRFANFTTLTASTVGLSDWLNEKTQQTSREDCMKVIDGLREMVDDLSIVYESLRVCFGNYDILGLYVSEYLRLIKLTLHVNFPPQSLDSGTAVALLKFLDWADKELTDSLEQDMQVWSFFALEVEEYYKTYSSQSQAKVISWLDNVIKLDLTSDEAKQCVTDDDCVFTNTPTDAFNTLDRYINSFLELLPARCLTEARVGMLVNDLTKAIGHIHSRLKNALEVGVVYAKAGELEDVVVVWLNGVHRKSYRYIIAQVNNLSRFETHIEDLKDSFAKRLRGLGGGVNVEEALLAEIDDCSELFGDVAAAGVDVLVHAIQLRVSACLQHQFTSKWLKQMDVVEENEDNNNNSEHKLELRADFEDNELIDLLSDHIGTIGGCGFVRRAYLGDFLKRVFRSTVIDYFESFLVSNLPLGLKAPIVFDAMHNQLASIGLLFEEYSDYLPAKILQQDIRFDSADVQKHTEEEVVAIFRGVVTCEIDFLALHFASLHTKFVHPRFIERGLPPILCAHALLAMRPDLNFQQRCEHLHAFELRHPTEPSSLRCVKDADILAFLSEDPTTRNKQVKHKLVGAKRDVGLHLERAKGLAKTKLKEANALAQERVQKYKDKRQQAKSDETEQAAWKQEGAKKLAQAKEKMKLWRHK